MEVLCQKPANKFVDKNYDMDWAVTFDNNFGWTGAYVFTIRGHMRKHTCIICGNKSWYNDYS